MRYLVDLSRRAAHPLPIRRMTDHDYAEILRRLGPARFVRELAAAGSLLGLRIRVRDRFETWANLPRVVRARARAR